MQKPKFEVEFLEEASEFLDSLDEKVRDKIIYNITKARFSNDKELFKKLTDEIWEFRTLFNKTHYRLFAFWDKSEKNVRKFAAVLTKYLYANGWRKSF